MWQTSIQLSRDLPEHDTVRPYHRQEIPGSAPGIRIKRERGVCPAPTAANNYITKYYWRHEWHNNNNTARSIDYNTSARPKLSLQQHGEPKARSKKKMHDS